MPSLLDLSKNFYIDGESDIPKDYMPQVKEALDSQEEFRQDRFEYTPRKTWNTNS